LYLTGPDEYFTHQVALPHAMVGSSDPSWRERYWLSIQDTASEDLVLSCGFGQYPNQDVQEAFVVFAHGGRQHNLRLARELSPRNDVLSVGPFRIEVVKPLKELRLVLDENPSGLAFDLRWRATMDAILEQHHFQVNRNRAAYDALRYVQVGRASGTIVGPAGERRVEPATWWGVRDHSWGTRPLPRSAGSPPNRPEWTFLLFAPLQLPTFSVHLYLFESNEGVLHVSGGRSGPLDDSRGNEFVPITSVEHDLEWVAGALAPTLSGGKLRLRFAAGADVVLTLRATEGRAHLRGGGYEGWNGWYQGHWKQDRPLEHETWDLTDPSSFYRYAKAGSDHLVEVGHGSERGFGIVEYMVLPGFDRYASAVTPRPV
jgi:hypothetical protein